MRSSRLPVLVTVAIAVTVSAGVGLVATLWDGTPMARLSAADVYVLGLAAVVGDRLVLPRTRGRATTMAVAVVAAVALLGQPPVVVAAMAAAAWLGQAVQAFHQERSLRLGSLFSGVLSAWGLAGVALLALATDPFTFQLGTSRLPLTPVVAVWLLLLFAAPAVEAIELAVRAEPGRRLRYRDLVSASLQSNTVLAATATLGALAYPELGHVTVLLMALPLLAAKLGFDRNTETVTTYDQTLRAMSRLPEQLGAVDPGHGVRAGEVAALAAIELGYGADLVTDIERAAQLHELGRIRTESGLDLTLEQVATGGAAIVTEAGDLDRVARFIAAHRGAVPVGDQQAWVAGAVVRLACDLDLRLTAREARALEPADQSWIRSQGVQPRIAEAIIEAARVHYAPTPA